MRHLTLKDRYYIELQLKKKVPVKQIAKDLGFSKVTIYAEIKRGMTEQLTSNLQPIKRYLSDVGQQKHDIAWTNTGRKNKYSPTDESLQELVYLVKDKKYSPVAAIMELGVHFCYRTFYNYVYTSYIPNMTLNHLPYARPKKTKHKKTGKRIYHPEHKSIEDRPKEILNRTNFGHWEMDTVYSSKDDKAALLVLTERSTLQELIFKMKDRTSDSVNKTIDKLEKKMGAPAFRNTFKTITCDNGLEFANSLYIEKSILNKGQRTTLYFCHPYRSGERGSNENQNRLIRRHIPKGDDIGLYSDKDIAYIQNWINNYPRRKFGGLSSNQYKQIFFTNQPTNYG